MQMFLWNNIFLSLGFDVKDHFKDFGGDAAAYAAPVGDFCILNQWCINFIKAELNFFWGVAVAKTAKIAVTLNNASHYRANGLLSDYIEWTNG